MPHSSLHSRKFNDTEIRKMKQRRENVLQNQPDNWEDQGVSMSTRKIVWEVLLGENEEGKVIRATVITKIQQDEEGANTHFRVQEIMSGDLGILAHFEDRHNSTQFEEDISQTIDKERQKTFFRLRQLIQSVFFIHQEILRKEGASFKRVMEARLSESGKITRCTEDWPL